MARMTRKWRGLRRGYRSPRMLWGELGYVQLERLKLIVLQYVAAGLAGNFADPPDVAVTQHLSFMSDDIVFRIKQEVWGREVQRQDVRYPADWREAVKERWLPEWAKRRWPVRYVQVSLVARELYPHMSLPPSARGVIAVSRSGG